LKRLWKVLFLLLLFNAAGLPCGAGETLLEDGFTLNRAISIALANNPMLKAKEAKWRSMAERAPQREALPDPKAGIDTWNIPEDLSLSETKTTLYWVSQKFPFPGKLKLRGAVAGMEAETAKVRWVQAETDLIADVTRSYHELLYIDTITAVTRENKNLAERLIGVIEASYSVGKSNLNDLLKERSYLDLLVENLALLTDLRAAEAMRLNALLGLPSTAVAGKPKEIKIMKQEMKMNEIVRGALENRHELKIDSLEIERSRKQTELAKKEFFPDFEVRLRRFQNYRSADGYGVFIGVSLPIWSAKNRARVKEAAEGGEAFSHKRRNDENRTRAEIRKSVFELNNALRFLRLYRESLIPRTRKTVQAAEEAYQTGKADFLDLYNAQVDLLNYKTGYRKFVRDYGFALAEMERIVGKRLDTEGGRP